MSTRRGDRGSVTAEFAIALPAVVVVVLLAVGAIGSASRQVRLQDAVADAARLVSRNEEARGLALVADAVDGARGSVVRHDDLVCVTGEATPGVSLPLPDLVATSCALAGGG